MLELSDHNPSLHSFRGVTLGVPGGSQKPVSLRISLTQTEDHHKQSLAPYVLMWNPSPTEADWVLEEEGREATLKTQKDSLSQVDKIIGQG